MAWRKPASLSEWGHLVWRHRKKAVFPGLAAATVAVIASFWIPREFKAEAKFQRRMDLTLIQAGNSTLEKNMTPIRTALSEDMLGRATINKLVDDLISSDDMFSRMWQFPHTTDGKLTSIGQYEKRDLVRQLQRRLSIRYQARTREIDQIVVSYSDSERELAPKIVNRLVENYIKNTRDKLNSKLIQAQRFFRQETDRYTSITRDMERKKLRFELDNPGLAKDDPGSVKNKLVALQAKRKKLEEDLHVKTHEYKALADFYNSQPEMLEEQSQVTNPEMARLIEQRNSYADQYEHSVNVLRRRPIHPEVIKLQKRIAELDLEIRETQQDIPGDSVTKPNVQRLEAQQKIQSMAAVITAMKSQLDETNSEVERWELFERNFFPVRKEYLEIGSVLSDAQNQLGFWTKNLRTTTVALTQEIGYRGMHLEVIQTAEDTGRPSKPTMIIVLGLAIGAGLGLATVMIILAELTDQSFHSVEQAVDDLKLPVLGAVNEIVTPGRAFKRRFMTWGVYPTIGVIMLSILAVCLFTAYVRLQDSHQFDDFRRNPIRFVGEKYL